MKNSIIYIAYTYLHFMLRQLNFALIECFHKKTAPLCGDNNNLVYVLFRVQYKVD